MSRFFKYLLVLLVIIALAIIFMPLRLAVGMAKLEQSSFSAQKISGTVWSGHIERAKLGQFALGNLDAGVQFFPLFTGSVKMDLERPSNGSDTGLVATIGKQGDDLLITNATTTLNIGNQLAPLPASNIELNNVSAVFADGRCQSASGQVRIFLDANIPGLDLKSGLLGDAICEDGGLILPLASVSDMEQLTLKLDANGTYTARLFLSGSNRGWTLLLPTLGFQKVPNGFAIKMAGQFNQ